MYRSYYKSDIGWIEVRGNEEGITAVEFVDGPSAELENAIVRQAVQELDEYFHKKRTAFTVPLRASGTQFQMKAWEALCTLPFGQTASYLDMAEKVGNPKAVRAIGGANNKNPLSIFVPCHRVIGKNGKLVGYGGGLWRKEWLLKHEGIRYKQ